MAQMLKPVADVITEDSFDIERKDGYVILSAKTPRDLYGEQRKEFEKNKVTIEVVTFTKEALDEFDAIDVTIGADETYQSVISKMEDRLVV